MGGLYRRFGGFTPFASDFGDETPEEQQAEGARAPLTAGGSLQLRTPEIPGMRADPLDTPLSLKESQLGDSIQTKAPGFSGEFSSQLAPPGEAAAASEAGGGGDYGGIAAAGIGAAGQMAGMLANVAAQKYAMDNATAQSAASRALSEKLVKMRLAADQQQFAKDTNLRALMWALGANKGAIDTISGGRELKNNVIQGMDQLLAKAMLKRG